MRPLWKTTLVLWTDYNPKGVSILELAGEATEGSAYCSTDTAELVEDPEADPDWDGTEFFSGPDGGACPQCKSTCWMDDPEGGPRFCESCGFIPE